MLATGAAIDRWLFLTIPFIALLGATSTAFDAPYLVYSRHHATRLERYVNEHSERPKLVATSSRTPTSSRSTKGRS